MKFTEFKLPPEIGELSTSGDYLISNITTTRDGFRIAFRYQHDDSYEIVFDFGYLVADYRVSDEGLRLSDHHVGATDISRWINYCKVCLLIEVKDSEYLKELDKAENGLLLMINPSLKHYITGDIFYSVDIISRGEPKVYKVLREKVCRD